MFLFYQKHNEFVCDIFTPLYSITEVLTNMSLCIWYNMIVCILLFLILITVLKYYK